LKNHPFTFCWVKSIILTPGEYPSHGHFYLYQSATAVYSRLQ
jgi:hypothetical protein